MVQEGSQKAVHSSLPWRHSRWLCNNWVSTDLRNVRIFNKQSYGVFQCAQLHTYCLMALLREKVKGISNAITVLSPSDYPSFDTRKWHIGYATQVNVAQSKQIIVALTILISLRNWRTLPNSHLLMYSKLILVFFFFSVLVNSSTSSSPIDLLNELENLKNISARYPECSQKINSHTEECTSLMEIDPLHMDRTCCSFWEVYFCIGKFAEREPTCQTAQGDINKVMDNIHKELAGFCDPVKSHCIAGGKNGSKQDAISNLLIILVISFLNFFLKRW